MTTYAFKRQIVVEFSTTVVGNDAEQAAHIAQRRAERFAQSLKTRSACVRSAIVEPDLEMKDAAVTHERGRARTMEVMGWTT